MVRIRKRKSVPLRNMERKIFRTFVVALALAVPVFTAEPPLPYASLEKQTFKPDIISEGLEAHAVNKKEPRSEVEHPVYRGDLATKGRAHIELVKSHGPVIRHEEMLADQPSSTEANRIDNLAAHDYGYDRNSMDVNYPDIPYAPGYGYDTGYATYKDDLFGDNNYLMEPDTSTLGLLWSQVPDGRTIVSYVGSTIAWMFGNIFMLFVGSALTVGVCSYTNLCTFVFHGIGPIHEEMRSLMSSERLDKLSNAADFVKSAIDKYQKIQKIADVRTTKKRRSTIY